MNDNLFSFPGEGTGQTGGDIFASDGFTYLGSADVGDNPFADMEAAAAAASEVPAGEPLVQAPAPQPQPQQAPTQVPQPQTAQQQAQPSPQASPNPGSQPQASAAPEAAEEPNPLMAAMDLQDQSNARKAAAPVFAQLPVFSYNGNEEPIEDTEQTFEELRLAKADDFPEFDDRCRGQ